jgi:tetratricopeptide (TPR) repeat protein
MRSPQLVEELADLEAKYTDHAVVQRALGQRHLDDGRTADAIRCWKRWVELSPSGAAFQKLAGIYLSRGEEDRWRETLEAALNEEDTGLFHARVRVDIAEYYMRKKDFKRAEPYALAAAESGAAWALLSAAQCEWRLEKWDEANEYLRAAAARYGHPAYDWYFTCRATGKMDREAAERAVRDYLREFGPGTTPGELFRAGRFHLLTGNTREARVLFDRAVEPDPTDLALLFPALIADAAGDAKARDQALARMNTLDGNKYPLKPLGAAIREWLKAGKPPTPEAVEAVLKPMTPAARGDAEFCVGWYLDNRRLPERAAEHWKRCIETEAGSNWLKTHSRACLETQTAGGAGKKP